ncbi:AAA family ATPase [Ramlibacter algicola]|uniref:AAA family ATPase n=1 Tax=Ramlibacter algicola TaxID=2795217 RepID=A0A934Q3Q4_9BURK|nr:AAA family ATPase [Ramlibacter algicola]MBK0394011.1 AAA family ATPase [Ramlibacter algicola]
MKIAAISPHPGHLQDIRQVAEGRGHAVVLHEGGKSRMRDIADRDRPDVMLVDGICCDVAELSHVEDVTARHPGTVVLLMCSIHTPEFLINSMRAGVREVLPSPAPREALEAALDRIESKLAASSPQKTGRVLAFVPCKGGSGATFLATNLAWQLAERGSVLLVDLNLQFGDALSFVHDGSATSTIANVARDIGRLDASLLAASTVKVAPNYSVLSAPEDMAQGVEVKPEHVEAILDVAVANYDFVVVDVARNLDTIAIRAFDHAWRIFGVMQSSLADLRNARRMLDAFRALGYPAERSELVVNRFERSAEIGVEEIQRALGGLTVRTVPNAYKDVSASINHADPIATSARSSSVAKALVDFAQSLSPRQEDARGLLGRLFRRA